MENVCDKSSQVSVCCQLGPWGNRLWDQLSRAEGLLRLSFRRHSFKELGRQNTNRGETDSWCRCSPRPQPVLSGLLKLGQFFRVIPKLRPWVALFTVCQLYRLWPGARAWGRHQGAAFWSRLSGVSVPRSLSVCRGERVCTGMRLSLPGDCTPSEGQWPLLLLYLKQLA